MLVIFMSPFLVNLFVAATAVAAIYPLHKLLVRKVHLNRTISALITLFFLVTIVVLPLSFFLILLYKQLVVGLQDVLLWLSNTINSDFENLPWLLEIIAFVEENFDFSNQFQDEDSVKQLILDSAQSATNFITQFGKFIFSYTANILSFLFNSIIQAIIFFLALFYFIRDGDLIVNYTASLMPLSRKYKEELFRKMLNLTHSIVYGIFGAALAQGLMLWLGFSLAGVENAMFWATIGAVMSPLPYIGTSIVWIPVVAVVFASGQFWTAIFLTSWCLFIVGLADNVVKPLIIGKATALHPFAVMLVIIGGTFVFGFKGIIFGPLVLTVTLAFLHIYEMEYEIEPQENRLIANDDRYVVKKIKKIKKHLFGSKRTEDRKQNTVNRRQ
jgi:predicted PurR-regulated permease PerM